MTELDTLRDAMCKIDSAMSALQESSSTLQSRICRLESLAYVAERGFTRKDVAFGTKSWVYCDVYSLFKSLDASTRYLEWQGLVYSYEDFREMGLRSPNCYLEDVPG